MTDLVDNAGRAELEGFWVPEHAQPSAPRLVRGSREQFDRELDAAVERVDEKIDQLERDRRNLWPLAVWQEWWFGVRNWR